MGKVHVESLSEIRAKRLLSPAARPPGVRQLTHFPARAALLDLAPGC